MAATKSALIELPLFDLMYQKNTKRIQHYFEFTDKALVFTIECYLDQLPRPDDEDGLGLEMPDQYLKQIDHIKKDSIYWIKSRYTNDTELWLICIYYGSEDTYCQFQTESEMRVVEKQLMDWLGW